MKWWHRFTQPREALESSDEREALEELGLGQICDLKDRMPARVAGMVVALTYPPVDAPPSLTVRIDDGTGALSLIFLGRTSILGIEPGRRLIAEGRVSTLNGIKVIFNPAYELLATS